MATVRSTQVKEEFDIQRYADYFLNALHDLGFGRIDNHQPSKVPGTTEKIAIELEDLNKNAHSILEVLEDIRTDMTSINESLVKMANVAMRG